MTYGQDSPDASYQDYFQSGENNEPSEKQQPDFDPSKYVPVDQFNELKTQYETVQPHLQTVQKLSEVFNPQTPQYTQEELAQFQRMQQVAQVTLNPELEQIKQRLEYQDQMYLGNVAKEFNVTPKQLENWYYYAQAELEDAFVQKNDQQAGYLSKQIVALNQSGNKPALVEFIRNNMDKISGYTQQWQLKPQVRGQQIGHGFNNSPFRGDELNPQEFEQQIKQAAESGDFAKARALQEKMREQIKNYL